MEMGNEYSTEMQPTIQNSPILALYIATPMVVGAHSISTAPNPTDGTQKFWVFNEQSPPGFCTDCLAGAKWKSTQIGSGSGSRWQ